ncbi:MAG: hypothetical protein ACI957_005494 [Verrucomicrobiales bacterium]|jgi:hypothetical protein
MKSVSPFLSVAAFFGLSTIVGAQTPVVDELIDPVSLEITGGEVVAVFDEVQHSRGKLPNHIAADWLIA